jgi:drug/metabolite transporter (DMT)-like permease
MRVKGNLAADSALILTTIFWGSTFVVTKDLLDYWPPITYLTFRFVIASFLLAALFPRQLFAAGKKEWSIGLLLGLLMGLGLAIQSTGLIYTTPSKSAFITGLTTPVVPFIALLLFRVRPNLENIVGVILASVGGFLILAPAQGSINTGDVITLGCLLLFATHITLLSVYTKRYDIRQITVLQIISIALVLGVIWIFFQAAALAVTPDALPGLISREAAPLVWSPRVLWQLLYMSTVATLGTFLLWAWGQSRMSATHAAIIFSLEPVFATIFAVLIRGRGEWSGGRVTVGAILIFSGVIISELRLRDTKGTTPTDDDDLDISIDAATGSN